MRPTIFLVIGYIAVGLFLSAVLGHFLGWSIMAGGAFLLMALSHPRLLLLSYWLTVCVRDYVVIQLLASRLLDWVDEIFVVLFISIAVLTHMLGRPQRDPALRWVFIFLIAILGEAAISTILNHAPAKGVVNFTVTYLGFFATFLVAYNAMCKDDRNARRLCTVAVVFLIANLLPNLAWLLRTNPLPNFRLGTADFAIGLCGNSVYLAHFSVLLLFLALSLMRLSPPGAGPRILITAVPAAVQLVISFANHAYVVAAVMFAVYISLITKRIRYALVSILAVAVFAGVVGKLGRSGWLYDAPAQKLRLEYLQSRWQAMVEGPKGEIFKNVVIYARRDMPFAAVGAGPGNFGSSVAQESHSPLSVRYIEYIRETPRGISAMRGGSIATHYITGFLAIYSELGPIGALLFFGFHLYAVGRVLGLLKRRVYTDSYQQALAEVFVVAMVQYLVMNTLTDLLHADIWQGALWIMAAAVWAPVGKEEAPAAGSAPEAAVSLAASGRLGGDLAAPAGVPGSGAPDRAPAS